MKVVILAGGLGTRIGEETHLRPKPMIEIGTRPLLWHIMKIYSHHGLREFIVCCGYRGYVIKEYFANYMLHNSDVTFDIQANTMEIHRNKAEPWRITVVDTGENSMTGGRLKRVAGYIASGEDFCFTYGDGVGDVNIAELIEFHKQHGRHVTVTAVQPPGRYGAMKLDGERIVTFQEKPLGDGNYINGGFFVLSPQVFDYIAGDSSVWEREPMERLAQDGQIMAYRHTGFWAAMDTLRDKQSLEQLWAQGNAPWKVWT